MHAAHQDLPRRHAHCAVAHRSAAFLSTYAVGRTSAGTAGDDIQSAEHTCCEPSLSFSAEKVRRPAAASYVRTLLPFSAVTLAGGAPSQSHCTVTLTGLSLPSHVTHGVVGGGGGGGGAAHAVGQDQHGAARLRDHDARARMHAAGAACPCLVSPDNAVHTHVNSVNSKQSRLRRH